MKLNLQFKPASKTTRQMRQTQTVETPESESLDAYLYQPREDLSRMVYEAEPVLESPVSRSEELDQELGPSSYRSRRSSRQPTDPDSLYSRPRSSPSNRWRQRQKKSSSFRSSRLHHRKKIEKKMNSNSWNLDPHLIDTE